MYSFFLIRTLGLELVGDLGHFAVKSAKLFYHFLCQCVELVLLLQQIPLKLPKNLFFTKNLFLLFHK